MSTYTSPPWQSCDQCGAPCRTNSGTCGPCQGRGESNALRGGRWVQNGLVRRYVAWTDEDRAERSVRAQELLPELRRRKVAALMAERYGSSLWWANPGPIPASAHTAAERVAALDVEFDIDERPEMRAS